MITICRSEDSYLAGVPAPTGLNVAVLCVTDTASIDMRSYGARMARNILDQGQHLADLKVVGDSPMAMQEQIQRWLDSQDVDVILIADEAQAAETHATPFVTLVSDNDETELFTRLMRDPSVGYVEVIDVRAAREWVKWVA